MKDENSHKHWQKLKEIFHDALELERDEREEYLNQVCGENEDLKKEVLSLLKAH